ncbi:hypothetical protein P168DRAFT_270568 [Aspergillus campestris IBT 28561]|uniref:Uncharacterized protein n=1 Tax=Aspergillus campestris (strain IBT 28561) TaxID=1392248 RepID=A0A2I1D214_ASPC2|nr:uncharacterized protein P168DRAFT_270568 [Aspergillus campestris IBT 28561]PKY03920.1 hypothetical protein P168DRAFT_270568 [Aspergillus campestris IBT 28561]
MFAQAPCDDGRRSSFEGFSSVTNPITPTTQIASPTPDDRRSAPVDRVETVSFEDLARSHRQTQHKLSRRKRLESRLHVVKVSMGLSARLVRVGVTVQRGLVDRLKHEDKVNFIALYHGLSELQESCESVVRAPGHPADPWDEVGASARDAAADHAPDFFLQLSPQSRTDVLEILDLARTSPRFVVDRLRNLSPAQLAALVAASAPAVEAGDAASSVPAGARSRTSASSFSKRSVAPSLPFKDHVLGFERSDALSILLFNVFSAPLDSNGPEAQRRLDLWASVCAHLFTEGGARYFPLIGHILAAWAMGSHWKARPKFELYLMDILQTGAFLLEHVDPPPNLPFDAEPIDPLRTDVAEEFFATAVDSLFQLLDDPDAGFPHAVMELSAAILQRLHRPDARDRFLEFLFVQWFFASFLYGALTYPEAHGLLLDFHIRKDAREKLLGQVGMQAYSRVFAVLRSMDHYAMARPTVRRHVTNMVNQVRQTATHLTPRPAPGTAPTSPAGFLMLSATDVLTMLNALFPRVDSSMYSPPSGVVPSSLHNPFQTLSPRYATPIVEPGFFSPPGLSSPARSLFPAEMTFLSPQEDRLRRKADRIRFELSGLVEPEGRTTLEPPATEDWAVFSIDPRDDRPVWGLFPDDDASDPENHSVRDAPSTTLGMEDNLEALQTAIVKLIQENPAGDRVEAGLPAPGAHADSLSLRQRFQRAMASCHHESDFIGAHYWWNAGRQLLRSVATAPARQADDSWILRPMHRSNVASLRESRSVIERSESDLVALDRHRQRLQKTVKDMVATVARLRDKMWYMTDVKNSMRYEDAKHVALALKTMVHSARLSRPAETRSRGGTTRSLLQKPELQVMQVMKAPSNQAGPNKLSDEQVDLIRKWLAHNSIDNFCRGEERIHRFCYEVKASINRLVGETMAETPVLWASELFHRERAQFEGSTPRGFMGLSAGLRSFGRAGEDAPATPTAYGPVPPPSGRPSDPMPRSAAHDFFPALTRDASLQNLMPERWRTPRDPSITDASSIAGSPGKAASTATGDSCSTFWSAPHRPQYYAASASSVYSRPPSMISETGTHQPRRSERTTPHGKTVFLDELRQTLTSLLLSDLGSPVWSCGSETDAWFGNVLDQERIRIQMGKRSRIQRFYAELDDRPIRHTIHRTSSAHGRRRSRSLEPSDQPAPPPNPADRDSTPTGASGDPIPEDQPPFAYGVVFRRLIDVFSRHGNPFVKLKALRELRALVVASLNAGPDDRCPPSPGPGPGPDVRRTRGSRHSFSESRTPRGPERDGVRTPTSPAAESVLFESRPSDYATPTEKEIVDALRELLLEMKPKTLFRDLQFIAAFVPGDTLNQTDSGTAFLQFGLAALSLKDEVCNSMVEIADHIVSQELSRRHPPSGPDGTPRPGHAIEDAAGMWIITAKEGHAVAQRELAILYLTHPELLPRVTLPLTLLRDTYKAEMMYHRDNDPKSDPQSMCLALHWMQLSAQGGDDLARNRLREREEFDSIA